jgi:5'-3' exonuclease
MQNKIINMFVDTDSIFFKIAYNSKTQNELRKNFNSFCRTMELAVKEKLTNPFDEEEKFSVLYAIKGLNNFRKELCGDYKAKRPELDKDIRDKLNFLHKHALKKGAVEATGMEADDLVSIWAYEARENKEQYVICGIDKDLLQIPGNHYNYSKDTWQFIDDETGHYNLMLQCLTGDSTDNIMGLKGIGPKKGAKLLEGVSSASQWDKVQDLWKEHGYDHAQCLMSYNLLRMLTSWKEYEDIKSYIQNKTSVRKPNDVQKQSDKADKVSELSK